MAMLWLWPAYSRLGSFVPLISSDLASRPHHRAVVAVHLGRRLEVKVARPQEPVPVQAPQPNQTIQSVQVEQRESRSTAQHSITQRRARCRSSVIAVLLVKRASAVLVASHNTHTSPGHMHRRFAKLVGSLWSKHESILLEASPESPTRSHSNASGQGRVRAPQEVVGGVEGGALGKARAHRCQRRLLLAAQLALQPPHSVLGGSGHINKNQGWRLSGKRTRIASSAPHCAALLWPYPSPAGRITVSHARRRCDRTQSALTSTGQCHVAGKSIGPPLHGGLVMLTTGLLNHNPAL